MNHTPCRNCGKNKLKGRCLCIPRSFWERDETREAVASGDVCRVIRLLRRHTNLTQEAIANLCGLTQSMVSRLESGERTLRDAQRRSQVLEALGAPAVNQQDPSPAASALTVDEQDRLAYALAHPSRLDSLYPGIGCPATLGRRGRLRSSASRGCRPVSYSRAPAS